MSGSATAKATEELSHLGVELEGLALTPIPSAAKGSMSGGVVAKSIAGTAPLGLWPGMGAAKISILKGGLFSKSVAGSIAPIILGSVGGATMIPAVMAGISVGTTFMIPFFFAGAAIGFAGSSIGKKGGRSPDKSRLAGQLPPVAGGAKSHGKSRASQPSIKIPVSGKRMGLIQQAMETARDLFKKRSKEKPFEFDRRFALRIKVPPGEMIVHGLDTKGQRIKGRAIDISMHGVKFRAPKTTIQHIEKVVFPRYDVTLKVKQANIHRQAGSEAVAVMVSFENGADGWMQWIELMSRLDREE